MLKSETTLKTQGKDMTEQEVRLGHCPKCGPDRSSDIVGQHHEHYDDDDTDAWLDAVYRILRCRGCGSVYYQESTVCSEDPELGTVVIDGRQELTFPERIRHWPPPLIRSKPEWCSQPDFLVRYRLLSRLLDDVYGTLNADLKVPTAVAARTAFEAAAEKIGIDPSISFKKKLDELTRLGQIAKEDRKTLDALAEAGNAAVHRGWAPNLDQLNTIISILENFLHRTFVLRHKVDGLSEKIPARPQPMKSS